MLKYLQEKKNINVIKNRINKNSEILNSDQINKLSNDIIKYYNITIFNNNNNKNIALMLETRIYPNTEFLLRQFSRFLPNTFDVHIYVTNNVLDKYQCIANDLNNNIIIKLLPSEFKLESVKDYNLIMLNISFWKLFIEYNKVLIFQLDTMIYKCGIENFLEFDYIGAPWPIINNISNNVGNGGFSIRTISAMIYCLENKKKINIPSYSNYFEDLKKLGEHPEDVFYSYAMNTFNYKVADYKTASLFAIETCFFNDNCIGSHQLNIFNNQLYNKLLLNSICCYENYNTFDLSNHRFGWRIVNDKLKNLFINKNKILFLSYADVEYLFTDKFSCNNREWVGIFHLTPINNKIYSNCDINLLKINQNFINDIQYCRGIFVLSKYLQKEVKELLKYIGYSNIIVEMLYHPIEFDNLLFNEQSIYNINTIVFIGSQLRRMSTIYKLKVNGYKKIWLPGKEKEYAINMLKSECLEYNISLSNEEINSVEVQKLTDIEYDRLILNSYIIIDQYNSSANNTILECIARNIPIFCNRLPAVEEYIGSKYPLFYNDIEHLEKLINNKNQIKLAHKYLCNLVDLKKKLTYDSFINNILNSSITRLIYKY